MTDVRAAPIGTAHTVCIRNSLQHPGTHRPVTRRNKTLGFRSLPGPSTMTRSAARDRICTQEHRKTISHWETGTDGTIIYFKPSSWHPIRRDATCQAFSQWKAHLKRPPQKPSTGLFLTALRRSPKIYPHWAPQGTREKTSACGASYDSRLCIWHPSEG